jgi:hypothetical protein
MSELTRSEELFEKVCADRNLVCRRIRTAASRRPDYKVSTPAGGLVVEVKQVDPNPTDKEYERQRKAQGYSFGGVSLTRLRPLVRDANRQLRPWALRGLATVVALYDSNLFQLYTEDHHVKSLFGDLGISVDIHNSEAAQDVVFATNQILTDRKNRSISAVLTVREVDRGPTVLSLFHNPFARVQLKRGCAERLGIREIDYEITSEL